MANLTEEDLNLTVNPMENVVNSLGADCRVNKNPMKKTFKARHCRFQPTWNPPMEQRVREPVKCLHRHLTTKSQVKIIS